MRWETSHLTSVSQIIHRTRCSKLILQGNDGKMKLVGFFWLITVYGLKIASSINAGDLWRVCDVHCCQGTNWGVIRPLLLYPKKHFLSCTQTSIFCKYSWKMTLYQEKNKGCHRVWVKVILPNILQIGCDKYTPPVWLQHLQAIISPPVGIVSIKINNGE